MILGSSGFDPATGKITSVAGGIELLDDRGTVAASWSFTKLIEHWQKKHNCAAYLPYKARKVPPPPSYLYPGPAVLGTGSHFENFLVALASGAVIYDPGSSMPIDGTPKARSQFRTKLSALSLLYDRLETVTL